MKTALIYISKHGTTERVAGLISEKISTPVELINLRYEKNPDISSFDSIILGGSIHAGMIQKRLKRFCENNKEALLSRKLGLFICCMETDELRLEQEYTNAYSPELRLRAVAQGILGGEFRFEKMNFLEKAIIKKISGVSESVSKINHTAIDQFVSDFLK